MFRCVGIYQALQPLLLIKDPELIKQITVKDFDAFPEHQPFAPEGIDSLWDNNLFAMKGYSFCMHWSLLLKKNIFFRKR